MTTTEVLERPAELHGATDDDLVHVVCCDANRALCGAYVQGDFVAYEEGENCCLHCDLIEASGGSCPVVFCWLRRWWRHR